MATSLGIHCGGNRTLHGHRYPSHSVDFNSGACSSSVSISASSKPRSIGLRMSMSAVRAGSAVIAKPAKDSKDEAVRYTKMDAWMRDSVGEIVKNLREAPLLVHVYSSKDGEAAELKTEKAVEERSWPAVIESWERKETPLPEGVIFVEQLEEDGGDDEEGGGGGPSTAAAEEEVTRAWGIVVQGKWAECGPICYLLKTSRGGGGPGVCCTHFCLMRVSNFRETARSQLKNCWLNQTPHP